ncbi:MAG: hypothetical protein PHI32_02590 [Dysgonamonadaceae bacterium]|nr:hypothetical protein [Dysgonamonadaceae bacterium]MDD4729096.1 hypothetical protein [Dysgonamonadaceae bacterium]
MKNKYIESLLNEIQLLESKVSQLKDNKAASFSFFRESFKRTQEIMRLLHELEFVQIEDMKSQMEKLVHFLSETEADNSSADHSYQVKENVTTIEEDESKLNIEKNVEYQANLKRGLNHIPIPSTSKITPKVEMKKDLPQFDEGEIESKPTLPNQTSTKRGSEKFSEGYLHENPSKRTHSHQQVDSLNPNNKSLNDVQQTNHTLLDTKRSISLNDRFLFQRELFDNDRLAMNNMMLKLQSFNTYKECERYLNNNTDWDFNDDIVAKFLEMLKEGF